MSAAVLLCSSLVAVCAIAGCGGGGGDPRPGHSDAPLPNRYANGPLDVSVRYPDGWRVDRKPLSKLGDPRQILAVSSYPIRQRHPEHCAPPTAIRERQPRGAFLLVLEARGAGTRDRGGHLYRPRPPHFHLGLRAKRSLECFDPAQAVPFQSAGRDIWALVYLGRRASPHTRNLAERVLDSLSLRRNGHAAGDPSSGRAGAG